VTDINYSRAKYLRAHRVLRETLGPASAHTCHCGSQARDWAYKEPAGYSHNPEDYTAMCRRCHIELDKVNANKWKTHCKRGHAFTPENTYTYQGKRQCRACHRITWRQRQCQ
jgi:hypothetical protein